jgi:hypothetical protein
MARQAIHPHRVRHVRPGRRRRVVLIRHRLRRVGGVLMSVVHPKHSTHH